MIDYKELLIKFIVYSYEAEGTAHIPVYSDEFTDEEKHELSRLDNLVCGGPPLNPFLVGREG